MTDKVDKRTRSNIMSKVRGVDTKPERVVRSMLHNLGYRFRLHRKDLPGRPDIVLPKYKAVIFVNGCFWHGHDCGKGRPPKTNRKFWNKKLRDNKARDLRNVKSLKDLGYRVLVIWECETTDPGLLRYKLSELLVNDVEENSYVR